MLVAGSDKQKEPHPENETEVYRLQADDEASVTPDEGKELILQPVTNEISLVIKEIIKLHEAGCTFWTLPSCHTRNTYLDLMASFEEHEIPWY